MSPVTSLESRLKRFDEGQNGQRDPGDAKAAQENEAKASAATKLVELLFASVHEFWHTPDKEPFATFKTREDVVYHLGIHGSEFSETAQRLTYLKDAKAIAQDAVRAAINTVAAQAKFAGQEHEVYSRIAHHDGCVWIDLGDDTWRAVRIDRDGWHLVDSRDVPVKFRRIRATRPLPEPVEGGSLEQLRALFRLEDSEWLLLVGWLVGCFQESGGRALLELIGRQGSGKSTLARYLVGLVDPSEIPVRSVSRDEEALLIAVQGRAVLAFDNVSNLHSEMADAWCRLSTGGGIGKRTLYSNDEETLIGAKIPLLWTSIVPVTINRPDLQDRTITVRLEALEGRDFRTERDIDTAFQAMRPQMLGALFTAVSEALQNQDTIELETMPRLADFATWVEAAAPAFGWNEGEFSTALEASNLLASAMAVDSSPAARLVHRFMRQRESWAGPVSDLLTEIKNIASDDDRRQQSFPKDSARLGVQMRRMQPPLARLGVVVGFHRTRSANTIALDRIDHLYGDESASPEDSNRDADAIPVQARVME